MALCIPQISLCVPCPKELYRNKLWTVMSNSGTNTCTQGRNTSHIVLFWVSFSSKHGTNQTKLLSFFKHYLEMRMLIINKFLFSGPTVLKGAAPGEKIWDPGLFAVQLAGQCSSPRPRALREKSRSMVVSPEKIRVTRGRWRHHDWWFSVTIGMSKWVRTIGSSSDSSMYAWLMIQCYN